jgi:hypothetical protein
VSAVLFTFSAVNPLKAQSQCPQSAPVDELRAEGYPITSHNEVIGRA